MIPLVVLFATTLILGLFMPDFLNEWLGNILASVGVSA